VNLKGAGMFRVTFIDLKLPGFHNKGQSTTPTLPRRGESRAKKENETEETKRYVCGLISGYDGVPDDQHPHAGGSKSQPLLVYTQVSSHLDWIQAAVHRFITNWKYTLSAFWSIHFILLYYTPVSRL
jgi:hypothetical protein